MKMKVSLRDRAIMLIFSIIGAVLIIRPIVAYQNFFRGNFFMDNGFTERAIGQYRRAIFLNPKFSDAYGYLGYAYKQKKQTDKAIIAYREALEINPGDSQVLFELGLIYHDREDYQKAVDHFKKAANLDSLNFNARNMEAVTYKDMGETEKAASIWEKILQDNPEYKPAQTNLEKLKQTQ